MRELRLDRLPSELLDCIAQTSPGVRAQLLLVNRALREYVRECWRDHSLTVQPDDLPRAWAWLEAQNIDTPSAVQSLALAIVCPAVSAPIGLRAIPTRFQHITAVSIHRAAVGVLLVQRLPACVQHLQLTDYCPPESPAVLAEFIQLKHLRSLSLGGIAGVLRIASHISWVILFKAGLCRYDR